jgi:hypothetical protein
MQSHSPALSAREKGGKFNGRQLSPAGKMRHGLMIVLEYNA